MTRTTRAGGNMLLDDSLFGKSLLGEDLAEPVDQGAGSGSLTKDEADAYYSRETGSEAATSKRKLRQRSYDPDNVLTFVGGDGEQRVPSRLGAVEWARDAVNWSRGTSAVAVAMAIALRIDETLVCWPRQERLAADVCATDRTVRTALRELEERRVVGVLYLWRGKDTSGCVYVLNVDGWLDDVLEDRPAFLRRVAGVRARGFELGLNIRELPKGTELSVERPDNTKGSRR